MSKKYIVQNTIALETRKSEGVRQYERDQLKHGQEITTPCKFLDESQIAKLLKVGALVEAGKPVEVSLKAPLLNKEKKKK